MEEFNIVLRDLMQKHGVNGATLARRCFVEPNTVWQWRSGGHLPGINSFILIIKALDLNPDELYRLLMGYEYHKTPVSGDFVIAHVEQSAEQMGREK